MAAYILILFMFCLIVGFVGILAARKEKKERILRAKTWTLEVEGVFSRAEYIKYNTIVHFQNSQTCVLRDVCGIPFPEGTRVKIYVNGNREYRIEKTEA